VIVSGPANAGGADVTCLKWVLDSTTLDEDGSLVTVMTSVVAALESAESTYM